MWIGKENSVWRELSASRGAARQSQDVAVPLWLLSGEDGCIGAVRAFLSYAIL